MSEAGTLLRDFACAQLARALACLARRGTRTHDGVHQGRKSLRRIRACIALASLERNGAGHDLDREISAVCRDLSELRDAHARVETLDALLVDPATPSDASLLRQARRVAAAERARALRDARVDDPEFVQHREHLQTLEAQLRALPWDEVDGERIDASLEYSLRRCRKAEARALDDGDAADWHRWRRRRRRLLQQHNALKACGIHASSDEDPQRDLAHYLGESQDLSVLIEYFGANRDIAKPVRRDLVKTLDQALSRKNEQIVALLDASGKQSG